MKRIARDCLLSIACAALAASAAAQERRIAVGATLEFMAGEPAPGPVVLGVPFSGDATTTVSQVLADGTRIERVTTARVFRDGQGRVRREQTLLGLGTLSPSGGAPSVVTIVDPVSGFSYALDPEARTARRAVRPRVEARKPGPPPPPPPPPPAGAIDAPAPPPPPPPPVARVARRADGIVPVTEQLGTREMEGVPASGTRRTEVIPAGRIGNDRPIEVVDERWESPALGMVIWSRHSDPRSGVVEYRLTNVSRAEPSPDLFAIPPDYTVLDARDDRFERRDER